MCQLSGAGGTLGGFHNSSNQSRHNAENQSIGQSLEGSTVSCFNLGVQWGPRVVRPRGCMGCGKVLQYSGTHHLGEGMTTKGFQLGKSHGDSQKLFISELWHFCGVLQSHNKSIHGEHEGKPRGPRRRGAGSHGQFCEYPQQGTHSVLLRTKSVGKTDYSVTSSHGSRTATRFMK